MKIEEIIDRACETRVKGDMESWLSLFSKDVMFVQPEKSIKGLYQLRVALEVGQRQFAQMRCTPLEVISTGEEAMYIEQIDAVTLRGEEISLKGGVHLKVAEGKISYMASYYDTIPFKRVLGKNI